MTDKTAWKESADGLQIALLVVRLVPLVEWHMVQVLLETRSQSKGPAAAVLALVVVGIVRRGVVGGTWEERQAINRKAQ